MSNVRGFFCFPLATFSAEKNKDVLLALSHSDQKTTRLLMSIGNAWSRSCRLRDSVGRTDILSLGSRSSLFLSLSLFPVSSKYCRRPPFSENLRGKSHAR